MNKYAKKGLIWTGAFIGIIMLLLIIIAAFFENQISDRLVKEINKQLKTELTVGEFNLSLLSGFPEASANLHQVEIDDTQKGTLLEAENLSFRFGLFSLFGSNIKIHSVVIEDGSLYIRTDKRGKVNYDIMKASSETTTDDEESDFALSLDEAQLNRVEVIYVDEILKQHAQFHVNKAVASGEFSTDQFSLFSFADIQFHFLKSDKEQFLVDEQVIYDAKIDVDFANGKYEFEDVSVGVASSVFNVDGMMETIKGGTNYDLKITSDEGSLAAMIALLSDEQQAYVDGVDSKGTFRFNTTIKGKQTRNLQPAISIEFGLDDGSINSDKLNNSLKDVSFTAKFSNGKQRTNQNASFEITDFKGYFNRELIEGGLRISNLDDPLIDFKIDGVIPMESIYGLFDSPAITSGDGEVEFKQLRLKGKYNDIISPYGIGRVDTSGEIEFDDAELTINDQEVLLDKGLLQFQDNSLKVSDLVFESPGTEIEIQGTFLNLLPVLFADSLNTKNAELKFNATLDAPEIDFDKLYAITTMPVDEDDVTEEVFDSIQVAHTHERERITKFLKGTFKAKIEEFNYEKIEGENFKGTLKFDNNEMVVNGKVDMMEGQMKVDGTTFFEDRPRLEAKLTCERMNVKEFFRQAENFGQEVLLDKNVKGKLDANFFIKAFWEEDATFLTDKLHVMGDVNLSDGEIVGLKMLYDFSDFIKIKDLQRIKFTNMQNYMEVKKSAIYMPAMFIQSNAMNLTISAKHTFENKIEYDVKVNAGQVLFNKFKKHNSKLKPQKAKKKGWFNLYYHIYGPMETFTYKSDKKKVKRAFELSDTRKRRIQSQLRREFGDIVSIEEPVDWKDVIPELEEPTAEEDEDEEVEFIDF